MVISREKSCCPKRRRTAKTQAGLGDGTGENDLCGGRG
jgi:hypothetical protein